MRTADGYVLAEALVERVLGEDAQVADRFHGRDMLGARYEPPFAVHPDRGVRPKGHTVLPGDFVTAEDGTGIVHTAIAFGEDDFRLGAEQGLNVINPVRPTAPTTSAWAPTPAAGSRTPTPTWSRTCARAGRLLRAESYLHAYPHCWRCGTPLLYYAKPSWYIRTSQLRDRLLAANDTVDWHPEHIKTGASASGWRTTSTGRSRASATGARRCRSGAARTATPRRSARSPTSRRSAGASSRTRTARTSTTWTIPASGGEMRRVPEVIDVWFDSGAMPFAQHHAPFENQEQFERASRRTTSARRSTRRAAGSTR